MPPPQTVVCEICHQQFSARSLAIHQKACVRKRNESTSFCEVCDQLVTNDEYGKHVAECRVLNARLLEAKKRAGGGAKAAAGAPTQAQQRSKIPESVLRRLEAAARVGGSGDDVEAARLTGRAGQSCDACAGVVATIGCVHCSSIYCAACSDTVHGAQ
jgi:hypothetical protein